MARRPRQFPVVNSVDAPSDSDQSAGVFIDQPETATIEGGLQGAELEKLESRPAPFAGPQSAPLTSRSSFLDEPVVGGPGMTEAAFDSPSADPSGFCCINGPCRHYMEWLQEASTADPWDWYEIKRVCRHLNDEEGQAELTDETVYACSAYRPPWWSPIGWVMRVVVSWRLRMARRFQADGLKPSRADLDPWWFQQPSASADQALFEQIEEEEEDDSADTQSSSAD